jgi:uncharacterized membrane protein YoaK (UPF0700 family)
MKSTLGPLLSFTGGYVDTAGFLALQGLFTAHVTGNFVTLGASLAHESSGAVAKLLALPVFCVVVVLSRLASCWLARRGHPPLRTLMALQLLLLTVGSFLVVALGPFSNGDAWPAVLTGMVLVAAMAVQNAAHRSHLTGAPPSTLMTGTTTQIMIDLADLFGGSATPQQRTEIHSRLGKMALALGLFAVGCATAALLYSAMNVRCFVLPPILAVIALCTTWPQREAITT